MKPTGLAIDVLDNRGIYDLARAYHDNKTHADLIGQRVNLRVFATIKHEHHQSIPVSIMNPEKPDDLAVSQHFWGAHIINFRKELIFKMKLGHIYQIQGIIVENTIDYGFFRIYVNELKLVEQAGAANPLPP